LQQREVRDMGVSEKLMKRKKEKEKRKGKERTKE